MDRDREHAKAANKARRPDGFYWSSEHTRSRLDAARRSGLRILGDPAFDPCELYPPEAFPTMEELAPIVRYRRLSGVGDEETGPNSRTVSTRFLSNCRGYAEPPTAAELYEAIRSGSPTGRQRFVIVCWLQEATPSELFRAWAEEVYDWRQLASAIHRVGWHNNRVNNQLNKWASPEWVHEHRQAAR